MTQAIQTIFNRDIAKLKAELELYQSEANIWKLEEGISNTAGNLTLHLIGNLNHFIGAVLGNTGYVRTRDLEFSTKDVPREKLLADLDATLTMLNAALPTLSADVLQADYPELLQNTKYPTGFFLIHLTTHLTYHLGQINYHRRLLDKS